MKNTLRAAAGPAGIACETWTGLVAPAHRPGARRQRVTLWKHPGGWPGEDCNAVLLGGTRCGAPQGPARPRLPATWRAVPGRCWCDADLPARYRALLAADPVTRYWIRPGGARPARQQRSTPVSAAGQAELW